MPMMQQSDRAHEVDAQQRKDSGRVYFVITGVLIVVVTMSAVAVWVIYKGPWSTSLSIAFVALAVLLSALVAVVQWLLPAFQKKDFPHTESTAIPTRYASTPQERNITTSTIPIEAMSSLTKERQSQHSNLPTTMVKTESGPLQLPPSPRGAFSPQPGLSPDQAFPYNQPLKSTKEFFGRTREVQTLLDRTRKGSSTSIVGESGIGKTWLMSYFQLIVRAELGSNFRIGYLVATSSQCSTVATFTASALQALGVPFTTNGSDAWGLVLLEKAVRELKSLNQTPILCIDEFHGFGGKRGFDLRFFDNLRAITYSGLVLIVASKLPLVDIVVGTVDQSASTSPFFNIFTQMKLKPFNAKEAEEFVRAKAKQVDLNDRECAFLLNYAAIYSNDTGVYETDREKQWPPARLQLAGQLLLQDKLRDPQRIGKPDYLRQFIEQLNKAYNKEQVVVHES